MAALVSAAALATGASLQVGLAFVVLIVATAFTHYIGRGLGFSSYRAGLWAMAGALVLLALFALISSRVYDLGYDSQSYHQLGILELARGGNPFHHASTLDGPYALFAGHYPIGSWLSAALLYLCTDDLESAKALQLLLIGAAFCTSYGALTFTGLVRRPIARWVALIAALNPVSIAQCMTFYVDGYLGSALLIEASALVLLVRAPCTPFFVLSFAASLVAVNAKFTGLVYTSVFVLLAGLAVALAPTSRLAFWRYVGGQSAALLLAVCAVGYHPYVTNTLRHDHPFYPLAGAVQVHDISFHRPTRFAQSPRVERLVVSMFADAGRDFVRETRLIKWPFTIGPEELRSFAGPDPRVAGWGPFFGGSLLLCIPALFFLRARSVRGALLHGVPTLAVLGSALLNAECWWARFTPQLCWLPLLVAMPLLVGPARLSWPRAYGLSILSVCSAGNLLVASVQLRSLPRRSAEMEELVAELAREGHTVFISGRWIGPLFRLRARGVPLVELPDDEEEPDAELGRHAPCAPLHVFPGTMNEIRYCVDTETTTFNRERGSAPCSFPCSAASSRRSRR